MKLRLALAKSLAIVALGSFGLCVSAQPVGGEPIVVGQRLQLRSQSLGEMRTYQVHRPPDYDISTARYPVLVVLDGEANFQLVTATVDLLAAAGRIPSMLVVGIPNTDRNRDMDSTAAPGSSAFLEFIAGELVPTIDRDYRTRPYRILVGHSGAGLFTLYALINAPDVFRGYIAIAPAFGDNRDLPETIRAYLEAHPEPNLNVDVFLTVDDATGMGLTKAWELSSYLQDRGGRVDDLRFAFRHYPAESHTAVPLRSVYDGLQSIFEGWGLDRDRAFTLYEQGGLPAIDKHFAALSARLGFPVAVPQQALTGAFGQLEGLKRFPEAEQVIQRAIAAFPESPAALYYAGRLYMQMGNTALAVETLKKSLLLSPNYPASRGLLAYMKVDPNELIPEVRLSGADLAKFVGSYGSSTVVFEIERRGDEIVGKTSEAEYELEALSATMLSYSGTYSSGLVEFRTDDRDRVTGLVFQNGPELVKLR